MDDEKDVRKLGAPSSRRKLSLKRQLFVRYFTDPEHPAYGNATRAAKAAGYRGQAGSSQLAVQGHSNLRNTQIREAIESALEEAAARSSSRRSDYAKAWMPGRFVLPSLTERLFIAKPFPITASDGRRQS